MDYVRSSVFRFNKFIPLPTTIKGNILVGVLWPVVWISIIIFVYIIMGNRIETVFITGFLVVGPTIYFYYITIKHMIRIQTGYYNKLQEKLPDKK